MTPVLNTIFVLILTLSHVVVVVDIVQHHFAAVAAAEVSGVPVRSSSSSSTTTTSTTNHQNQKHVHRELHLAGGYQQVSKRDILNDQYIEQAADLVLTTLQEQQHQQQATNTATTTPTYSFASKVMSYRIIQAEQQVVAGMNYKLTMLFGDRPFDDSEGEDGDGEQDQNEEEEERAGNCVGACRVIVYNHFGDLSITEWSNEMTCEEVLAMEDDQVGDEN